MDIKKVKEVFSDTGFVRSLFELDDVKQVQESLANKGLDFSLDEINEVKDILIRHQSNELSENEKEYFEKAKHYADGELGDDDLENVTGGVFGTIIIASIIAVAVTGAIMTTGIKLGTGLP